ncbi:MAG: hypothetical protein HC906_10405 [Bacteroidales bacterium]|nr:hypothetical protein [Bacteroidales bacterium]
MAGRGGILMVGTVRNISSFLRIIRLPNLLMVILTMLLIRYCIILPMLTNNGLSMQLTRINFILLIIAVVLITAAGYVINDYSIKN